MTYSFIIPSELLSKIYYCREAGMTKSIRGFVIAAIELKLQGYDGKFLRAKENE